MEAIGVFDAVATAKRALDDLLVKTLDFFVPGELIGDVREVHVFEHGEVTDHTFEERNLLISFNQISTARYHFDNISVGDIFDISWFYSSRAHPDIFRRRDKPLPDIFKQLATEACHGDIEKQETVVDTKVRKGKDLSADNIKVNHEVIRSLKAMFSQKFRMSNIKVVPYKINYYEDGDFFTSHRDHPEKDLIGTILFHIAGDEKSFFINEEMWDATYQNVCMFFTDVPHEVKPVKNYRETMSFKVYATAEAPSGELTEKEKEIYNRLTSGTCGVVLQNGYTVTDENYKGVDKEMYDILIKFGRTVRTIPVVVTELTHVNDDHYKFDIEDENYYVGEDSFPVNTRVHLSDLVDDDDKIRKPVISVYNLKGVSTEKKMPVFFLGKGFKLGERCFCNQHIGNQYSGKLIDNVYVNKMFVIE